MVCLVARQTGRALQIVAAPDGRLVVDGLGVEGPKAYNSKLKLNLLVVKTLSVG